MPPKIFYQSSFPRAGSTLLQNILAQNPALYVTPTSGLMELIQGARVSYSRIPEFSHQDQGEMKKAFLAFIRTGMGAYFQALTDKPYVVDKCRGWGAHFDLLQLIFDEDPKIICIVRDLRQILSSFEKRFRMNPDKYKPIENHANLTGITTLKRAMMNLQSPPVGAALERLAEIHQRGWARKILFVRFEDLTTGPAAVMKTIYQYLGISEFAHDFDHVEQLTHEDDNLLGLPGLHDIRPKVEVQPKDYMEILGPDIVRHVQQQYAWYFQLFNYQLTKV